MSAPRHCFAPGVLQRCACRRRPGLGVAARLALLLAACLGALLIVQGGLL